VPQFSVKPENSATCGVSLVLGHGAVVQPGYRQTTPWQIHAPNDKTSPLYFLGSYRPD